MPADARTLARADQECERFWELIRKHGVRMIGADYDRRKVPLSEGAEYAMLAIAEQTIELGEALAKLASHLIAAREAAQ